MNAIKAIEDEARRAYETEGGSHDWSHATRVRDLSMRIGRKEGADLRVLELAAILHDIGRQEQDRTKGRTCHAKVGAAKAKELMIRFHLDIDTADRVINCIESHRSRGYRKPETIEERVLFDADKLDGIGAIGIGRAFLFAGQIGAKLHNDRTTSISQTRAYTREDTAYREFVVKLSRIRNRMLTTEGARIAEDRHEYMAGFFVRLQREIDGEL